MKRDYLYIFIIGVVAILGIFMYITKPVNLDTTAYDEKIDSLTVELSKKDSLILKTTIEYEAIKKQIQSNPRPSYKPIPISERNRTIIKLAEK